MSEPLLPSQFPELEPYAATWALPTEHERYARRLDTTMDEMQAFYDAIVPRAEEAIAYCDTFPLDDMPDDTRRLLYLLYSMITVSFPIECWGQPRVPDTGATFLDLVLEPGP